MRVMHERLGFAQPQFHEWVLGEMVLDADG
jgi:hypothetical protein